MLSPGSRHGRIALASLHSFHDQFPKLRPIFLIRYLLQLRVSFHLHGALYPVSWTRKFLGKLTIKCRPFAPTDAQPAYRPSRAAGIYAAMAAMGRLPAVGRQLPRSGVGALRAREHQY